MRRAILVMGVLSAAACGTQEYEALLYGTSGDNTVYVCPSGEMFALPTFNITNPTPGGRAQACLGLSQGSCPSESGSGGVLAGDPQCDDPTFNQLAGTCVEAFFECFRPTGACRASGGTATWDSGHSVQSDGFSATGSLYPAGAQDACMFYNTVTEADLIPGAGSEIQYLKPF